MRLVSEDWPYVLPDEERTTPLAYVLWALWGMLGVHRLYLGKPVSALVWLLTSGLLGLGWLYDAFTMPAQVEWFRMRRQLLDAGGAQALTRRIGPGGAPGKPLRKPQEIMMALLRYAQAHGGSVSVTEGVIHTGAPFRKVEAVLKEMLLSGYVDVTNDASGTVRYVFPELTAGEGAAGAGPAQIESDQPGRRLP